MSNKKRAKKIILVDRSLQFRYARIGMGIGLLSSFLTALMILFPLYYFKILVIPNFLPTPILALIVTALVLNMVLVGIFGVFVSHRIAGPVFAIVRQFRSIQDGQFNVQLRLRNDDDLTYLVKHLNETAEALVALSRQDLEILAQNDLATLKSRFEKRLT